MTSLSSNTSMETFRNLRVQTIPVKIWQAWCLFLAHAVPPVHSARSETKNFSFIWHFLRQNEQINELNFVGLFVSVVDIFCTTECLHGLPRPILRWSVLMFATAGILFILFCVSNRAVAGWAFPTWRVTSAWHGQERHRWVHNLKTGIGKKLCVTVDYFACN